MLLGENTVTSEGRKESILNLPNDDPSCANLLKNLTRQLRRKRRRDDDDGDCLNREEEKIYKEERERGSRKHPNNSQVRRFEEEEKEIVPSSPSYPQQRKAKQLKHTHTLYCK